MPFMRKYNTLLVTGTTSIRIPIIKRAVVDFALGADWTPAAGDVKVFVDAAAAANITNLPTAIASGNGAFWEFILTAAELSCQQLLVVVSDAATKAVEDQSFIVETYGNASARYVTDLSAQLATPTNITAGTITTATNVTTVNGLAANVITATSINADALTAAKIADDVSTEIANKVWDTDATGRQTQGTFGQAIGDPVADTNTIYKAVVTDATGATVGVDVVAVKADTAAILADTGTDGVVVNAASLAADAATEIANAVWDTDCTGRQTQGTFGQAIGDPVADTNTIYKAVVTDATGATVGVDVVAIKAETVEILADTDDIGVAGAGLTAIDLPDQTMNITGNLTGNVSGSVGSVTGAVGSVTGAVGSVTGAVGSVTGNVGGNVVGSVASVTAAVTVGTINANVITATSINADAITAAKVAADVTAEIADGVWDEAIAGHLGAGSTGEKLNAAGAAGDPWNTALPGAYGAGTAGKIVGDNVNAPIATVDTVVDAIKAKTDSLTFTVAGHVDANIKKVNGVTVTGTGAAGDEWGP